MKKRREEKNEESLSCHSSMFTPILRVGSIGDGLFVIFLFSFICLLVCFIGSKTSRPALICWLSTLLLLSVILFLALVPKEPPTSKPRVYPEQFDNGAPGRVAVVIILLVWSLIGTFFWCREIGLMSVTASKIRHWKREGIAETVEELKEGGSFMTLRPYLTINSRKAE
jgi:hypothetical protein